MSLKIIMNNKEIGNISEQGLTSEAILNYKIIGDESIRRQLNGLTSTVRLQPVDQVKDYLNRVGKVEPAISFMVDRLIMDKKWKTPPEIIACIPVVGTENQEVISIQRTLSLLTKDPAFQSGQAGVLVLVNRPVNFLKDETALVAETVIKQTNINGIVLETEIPLDLGNVTGSFADEMATQSNDVAIGLIRDILNISAMKTASKQEFNLPLILQMDADFEGFMKGSILEILSQFNDSSMRFLQCSSDWDSAEFSRDLDSELFLGANLMRELPQILKSSLNNSFLPTESRQQILFGEAIQRGIQVPQVERMEDIAFKGGYGLNRLAHDELDANIRQSAFINPQGIKSTSDVIFLWNNRRAVRTWREFRQPPISQWINPFAVVDPVRQSTTMESVNEKESLEAAVNKSLERFPVPKKLIGVYEDFKDPVLQILSTYFPDVNSMNIQIKQQSGRLYYLQVDF